MLSGVGGYQNGAKRKHDSGPTIPGWPETQLEKNANIWWMCKRATHRK